VTRALDAAQLDLDPRAMTDILTRFLRIETGRCGFDKVVFGLSGGIDSAVVAYLAARAFGPDSVKGVRMPHRASSPDSLADARLVIDDLGIESETVEITGMVDSFEETTPSVEPLRLGNVMARSRMIVLYDRSAADRSLVLGTSNKTELLLGYGTLHGDMASALNPIGDLYKTQVRTLATHLGVPESIRNKPPSADLWVDQSDESELGFTYELADRLLVLLVDARVSRAAAIDAGFDAEFVDRLTRMVVRSQFKRRPTVIAKVSTRTIGWDFRYPRDWRT
jgi:NAD+ synthase